MAKKDDGSVEVTRVTQEVARFHLLGTSPFVNHAMSAKVKGTLLAPYKKTKSERESTQKHEPIEEYRASCYRARGDASATRIEFPAAGFKRAMANAATDMPGVNRSQMDRLCWAEGHMVSLYGIPELWMTVVRSSDQARTPDIRTRAIIPEWAASVDISFVVPNLRRQPVVNLMAAAGVFIGVGDGRPQKGALSFGRFEIVAEEDERYQRIVQTGGRVAQDHALENPTTFDIETEELLEWWKAESRRKGFTAA